MKLERIRVEQLRKFRDAVEIDGLEPGLNLFVGPNESGKSTLVRAIRAAFFERHRSSSAEDLRPWGDSAAAPTVELEFVARGQRWKMVKSFLRRKRCDLSIDGADFSGEEAEEKLADLLGFEYSPRGASRPQHWGVPGLLWIEQGSGQEVQQAVEHAGAHLQAALGSSLGELTSSGGDELIARVSQLRSRLLTATGRPTADYATTIATCEQLAAELAELQEKIERYRQQVDRLGELRRARQEDEAERIWEGYREQVKAAEQQLQQVARWQGEQERDRQVMSGDEASIQTVLELLDSFGRRQQALQQRAAARDEAEVQRQQAEQRAAKAATVLQQARAEFDAARPALQRARQHQQAAVQRQELQRLDEDLQLLEQTVTRATGLHQQLQQQLEQAQGLQIDDKSLRRLRQLGQELDRLAVRQQVFATRLQFELLPDARLELDGEALVGRGERSLLAAAEVKIEGVGRLQIMPGGEEVAELARRQQRLQDEQTALLVQLGVSGLAAAEERLEQRRLLEEAIRRDQSVLASLAPQGLEELAGQRQRKQGRRAELAALMAASQTESDEAAEALPLAQAEARFEAAESALRQAERADAESRSQLLLATQAGSNAAAEWQRLAAELEDGSQRARQQQANAQLLELRARLQTVQQAVAARQQQIDTARPDSLRLDIERLTRSADMAEKQAAERRLELERIQSSLEVLGAEGLEEQAAELAARHQQALRRQDEMARRARALDWLLELLKRHRQRLTRQLQAPLQLRLNHYLQQLLPQAALSVDEQLVPELLVRPVAGGEEHGHFAELSYGAREQMGLISRLAYADLLQEAGRPTLIMLDDALVHSDLQRLQDMKRILFDAARRHQILLFSCHPQHWRDLGVEAREVSALGIAAAAHS